MGIYQDQLIQPFMSTRFRRSTSNHIFSKVQCPKKLCEDGKMQVICNRRRCPDDEDLPNCWFALGVSKDRKFQIFNHFLNFNMYCMPVCAVSSYETKMPTIYQVETIDEMCEWFKSYGQCPYFIPNHISQA